MLKECTYGDLKTGDIFTLRSPTNKSRYRKEKSGATRLIDSYGCKTEPPLKITLWRDNKVYKLERITPPSCLTNDERREELLERYKEE